MFLRRFRNSATESDQITFIPAKVISVDTQSDKHRVLVRILLRKYKGSFNTLKFGENKPLTGSCHDGQLILFIAEILDLKKDNRFRCGGFSNRSFSASVIRMHTVQADKRFLFQER
jgi:hypothetical protein